MRYEVERAAVVLSVGELCEIAFLPRDLDLRYPHAASPARAALGADVHRRLQAEAGALYTSEVSFTHTELYGGLHYEVSGRADGIIFGTPIVVDEIKTVKGRLMHQRPDPRHEAQMKCYAYFLCVQRELDEVQGRLTYYCIDDGSLKYVTATYRREELREFFLGLLSRVEYRAQILAERETLLRPSAAEGHFPYSSVREGQDVLIKECYRDIRAGKRLFAEAPTGIGKTVSTLYPAVRALGEGHVDKIFYLTAKAAVRREAFSTAAAIFEAGAHLRTLVLTARDQLCKNEPAKNDPAGISHHCNPVDCPLAKGFYEKCGNAVCELLSLQSGYSRQTVEQISERYGICPYEFQLELSEFCDVLICDYNYVFDPQIYLRRYFSEDAPSIRSVLLVDEAHNLAARARSMYSVSLTNEDVAELWRILPESDPLRARLERLSVTMHGFRRLCRDSIEKDAEGVERGYYLTHSPMEELHKLVEETRLSVDAWLRTHRGDGCEADAEALSSKLKRFSLIAECYDRSFLTFIELEGDLRTVRLLCLDPASVLDACLSRAHAAVLFSATLTPIDYFADILGGGKHAIKLSLPSPFDPKNLYLCAVTGISTRFEDRQKSYRKLVSVIAATATGKRGNYIVYFPSYDYMEHVFEAFTSRYPEILTVRQTRGMSPREREAFLDSFLEDGKLRIGFCVLGGSFSEGVDLPGKRLIGTVIVGTGLSAITNEGNILCEHYEATRERGFDYAYVYPGMNRVLQAAGRVIRRDEDRGVVILVDDRYAEPRQQMLFPEHWEHVQYARNATELAENVREFWKTVEK